MSPGIEFVLEQLGLALAAADARIQALTAENQLLREEIASTRASDNPSQSVG